MFGRIFFVILLGLFSSCLNANEVKYNYILKNADLMKFDQTLNDTITTLTGEVNLIYDDIEFFADNAQIFQKDKIVKLTGNVRAIDDTLEAGAHQAIYFHKKNELNLQKEAYFIENSKNDTLKYIKADKINYLRDVKKVEANGSITAEDFNQNTILVCGKFDYDFKKKYGQARINPILTFKRKNIVKVLCKQMEFFSSEKKFTATYDVKIEMKDSYAIAHFLIYFQEEKKAVLVGNPKFYSKTTDALADEFQIFFIDETIDKIYLIKNAKIYFKNESQTEKSNYIFAQKVMFELNDNKLSYMNAEKVAESLMEKSNKTKEDFNINKLTTNQLEIIFDNEEAIEKIIANNDIFGIYKFMPQED